MWISKLGTPGAIVLLQKAGFCNSKDPKNDPRHLRLIGDSLMLWEIRPPIGVRHAHNNSNDDDKYYLFIQDNPISKK